MDNLFLCEYLGTPPRVSKNIDLLDKIFRRILPWIRIGSYWRGEMASIESRMNIYYLIRQLLMQNIEGDFVEVGCNSGESTVIIQHLLEKMSPGRALYAYDSFQGVPALSSADEGVYKKGDMSATQEKFFANFDRLKLKKPIVHAGWFEETLPDSLPERIAFALVDGDLYESTLFALTQIYPRLTKGAICLLGVYWDPSTRVAMTTDNKFKSPGVKKACDHFLTDKPESVSILLAGNYTSGYFCKQ